MVIAATILEPFTESILSGIVFALALHCFLPSAPRLVVFTTHTIAWLLLDLIIYHTLSSSTSLAFLPWLKAWLLRELLAFPIWLIAVCGSRVEWRGEVYKMNWRGEAVRVDPVSPSRWWFSTTGAKRAGYEAVASED
jgi:ceramide glucosyltransferase